VRLGVAWTQIKPRDMRFVYVAPESLMQAKDGERTDRFSAMVRPELAAIASNEVVNDRISSSYALAVKTRVEQGFWILKNRAGVYDTRPFTGIQTKGEIFPGPKPEVDGWTVVATFHTHQDRDGWPGPSGEDSGPFGKGDIPYAARIGIPGIIQAWNREQYYFGPAVPKS
jgi:hypothetical protein